MMRLGRCIAFLAAAAFLLPFTILLMVADQQYNLTYSSKRVFYQEINVSMMRLGRCIAFLAAALPAALHHPDDGGGPAVQPDVQLQESLLSGGEH
ncbi:Uncharacterized protein OBRU01_23025 [Operophtera brumata]|uniref:Uncharacterized protein n=1 Tax=Operophtera brumata TaxID=104452 RepID=A0A0L7KPQ4_OPEBR|nr:Uncharacterized protein OBRU01_23025 [Operophtera brumata]